MKRLIPIRLGLLAGVLLLAACSPAGPEAGPAMGPPEVTVAPPLRQTITEWDEYTGRFRATESVEMRARVTGYLDQVAFEDGQLVAKGDLLFVIDRRPFEYALERAKAQHALAVKEYERAETLLSSRSIPQEEFDRRFQEVQVTQASLQQAQLDLEFTEVRSPIDGKASRDLVNVGNLVRANETILTNIVSLDPIHFYFDASQADLLKYIRLDRAGQRPSSDTNANQVLLQLPDERDFPHQGEMDFVDNRVDASTGTIQGRAVVPNPGAVIYPGMFGRARLVGRSNVDTLSVPRSAINTDQSRRFVYVVDENNQAQRAYVELGRILEGDRQVIETGLTGDERVVVNGLQRIRMPSQPVPPVTAGAHRPGVGGFAHFFNTRPTFATVLSILAVIVGSLAYVNLPIEQYPQVAPPTVQVIASYPGANARTVSETLATPLEQEINGVEGMLYMLSQSTGDGRMTLTITFELGTDLDQAQVLVQNRVAIAEPRLPEEVRRLGVITRKNSPDLMMVINLFSPDGTYDQTYIGNYAVLQVRDRLRRIDGVGDIQLFGAAEYAMRVWLDPDLIQSFGLTAGDVVRALRGQNVQVAGGTLNQSPQPVQGAFELSIETQGRLIEPEQFENIVVKSGEDGRIVRLRDVGRVELGAQSYTTRGYLGEFPAVALPVFQRPGTNAIETADALLAEMDTIAQQFPPGLEYAVVYNPTEFIAESVNAVVMTIFEAALLVVIVIIVFLQTWRAALIPIVAIPVSLVGTFAVLQALGISLNSLSLFGLVLAIGIVVDDAIVVVENMERNMREGLSPKAAAHKTMDEVGSALIAMGLVLVAVFLPTIFLEGISGRFYQQFGVTVAVATAISVVVSLTLSPAMAALMMRPHDNDEDHAPRSPWRHPLRWFFCAFNAVLERVSRGYHFLVKKTIRLVAVMLLIYAGLMALAVWQFERVPSGFIPPQDQGYFIISIQLPPGASLERTDAVVQQVTNELIAMDGVVNAVAFSGFAGATFTNASNAAAIFPVLDSFENREAAGLDYTTMLNTMRGRLAQIQDAFIVVIPPPPVPGIGNAGGFRLMVQDRLGRGLDVLEQSAWALAFAAAEAPATTSVFTFFENATPQIYLDIDREKAERLGVSVDAVFEALEVYIGSSFINDFNYLGRTFQVTAQADSGFRLTRDDAMRIRVRNRAGDMVPIGAVATVQDIAGPSRVPRYNLYPSAALIGDSAPGYSLGQAIETMEGLAAQVLPDGISYEWTEIAYQQKAAGGTAATAFVLAVVFVFLLLAAQYESWTLPLAVILIVPMCLLSAITGLALVGMDNNVLTQIGFVVLIGLAAKNAILIVEFARELEAQGMDRWEAAEEAARLRLRPILMTSFAFILGVVPLVIASGAGAEMRQAIGTTVFSGMLGVTIFGLVFTPVFYVLTRRLARDRKATTESEPSAGSSTAADP